MSEILRQRTDASAVMARILDQHGETYGRIIIRAVLNGNLDVAERFLRLSEKSQRKAAA